MDKKIDYVNTIRSFFYIDKSYTNWQVKDNCINFIYRIPNLSLDTQNDNVFFNDYIFFNDNYNKFNQIDRLIIKLFSISKEVFIDFLDFNENRVVLSFNIDNFSSQTKDFTTFLMDKFNYNSDFGFHLFMNNKKWTYFFGENLFLGSHIEKEKPWENYHLFTVNKDNKVEFMDAIKDDFIVEINNEYYLKKSNFGKNLYNLMSPAPPIL